MKELTQIIDLETYQPILALSLSWKERKKVLESLLFITEKRNEDIKARTEANGSKQRMYNVYDKSGGSSPKVVTENIFIIGVLGAHEGRYWLYWMWPTLSFVLITTRALL